MTSRVVALFLSIVGSLKLANTQSTTSAPTFGPCTASVSPLFTTTISLATQAALLAAACPSYDGCVAISDKTTENLNFTGLENIGGHLMIFNIRTPIDIAFPNLKTVNSTLWMLGDHTNNVAFDSLTAVGDLAVFHWNFTSSLDLEHNLPSLLSSGSLRVQNSTFLVNTSLSDISLPGWSPYSNSVTINNLKALRSVALAGASYDHITIINSGEDTLGQATGFSLNFTKVSAVTDILLENNTGMYFSDVPPLSGSLRINNNNAIPSALTIGELSKLSGSLQVSGNELTSLSVPHLYEVQGDLIVTGNHPLVGAGDFPSLKTVSGSIELAGPISTITYADQLGLVGGTFAVDSTTAFPCNDLYKLLTSKKVLTSGNFSCRATSDSSGQSDGSKSDLSSGAIAGIAVGVALAVILAITGVLLCWRSQRRRRDARASYLTNDRAPSYGEAAYAYHDDLRVQEADQSKSQGGGCQELSERRDPAEVDGTMRFKTPLLSSKSEPQELGA